jgi:hypothetical protein
MRGITVMMLGFVIGIILVVAVIIFIVLFYEGDLFDAILKGLGNQLDIFGGGASGGGGAGGGFER